MVIFFRGSKSIINVSTIYYLFYASLAITFILHVASCTSRYSKVDKYSQSLLSTALETPNVTSTESNSTTKDEGKKKTRLGIKACKEENLSLWYSQVLTNSEMIDYYNVSGCYIIRPWGYAIWDFIKDFIDKEIQKLGVENGLFPMFVPKDALEKEKIHISDFSSEMAWVTKCGSTNMTEPVGIRRTSETIIYPSYAKWIQSDKDLPIKFNQFVTVVRWEIQQTIPFLRSREFLLQEGHTAFATKDEAVEEAYTILDIYEKVYEDLLAVPVVKGKKTEKEKFAGGDFTTTTEAYIMGSGRAIQGASSHYLGQNYSKAFNVVFEDHKTKEESFVYQNCWGISSRTIGVMVMVHSDNRGLCLPPRVAKIQVIIVPVGITAKTTIEDTEKLLNTCQELNNELTAAGIRAKFDNRDNVTSAWKFNLWELKGIPLRIELGPREMSNGEVFVVRRDTGDKQQMSRFSTTSTTEALEMDHNRPSNKSVLSYKIKTLLSSIQKDMFTRAAKQMEEHKILVHQWQDFLMNVEKGNLLLAPFCGEIECEDAIMKDSSAVEEPGVIGSPSMGAKGLCIPFEQPGDVKGIKCIHPNCSKTPHYYTLFGRSY